MINAMKYILKNQITSIDLEILYTLHMFSVCPLPCMLQLYKEGTQKVLSTGT